MSNLTSLKDYKNSKIYYKCIEKIQKNFEYKENEQQIRIIRKVLTNNAGVPYEMLEQLIECIQENVAIEYESTYSFNKTIY